MKATFETFSRDNSQSVWPHYWTNPRRPNAWTPPGVSGILDPWFYYRINSNIVVLDWYANNLNHLIFYKIQRNNIEKRVLLLIHLKKKRNGYKIIKIIFTDYQIIPVSLDWVTWENPSEWWGQRWSNSRIPRTCIHR